MKKTKKIAAGILMLGFFISAPIITHASSKYNWKNYFSFNEMASMRRKATDAVKNNFENDSDWKDVISGKNIKDNAITTDKIKNGTIKGDDLSRSIDIETSGDITTTGDGDITSAGKIRAGNGLSAGGVVNFAPADIVRFPTAILGDSCTDDGAVGVYPAGSAGERILVCDGSHWIGN